MKIIKCLLLFSLLFVVSSCSKPEKNYTVETVNGIKTYKNKNEPADPKFKIETKELFTILGDQEGQDSTISISSATAISVDTQKNIYILNDRTGKIIKFDAKGKHLLSFGGLGQGPGEMTMPFNMSIMSDTVFVFDYANHITHVFDLNGKFVRRDYIDNLSFIYFLSGVNADKSVGIVAVDRLDEYPKVYTIYQVTLFNRNSTKFKILDSRKEILQPKDEYFFPSNYMSPYAVGKDKIYVLENSTDRYKVSVYDFNGSHLYDITKNYAKIPLTNDDLNNTRYAKSKLLEVVKFKNAANVGGLHVTKDGYLLVQSAQRRNKANQTDYIVDAFKDSVYINTFNLNVGKGYDFFSWDQSRYFIDDKIYFMDREKNSLHVLSY